MQLLDLAQPPQHSGKERRSVWPCLYCRRIRASQLGAEGEGAQLLDNVFKRIESVLLHLLRGHRTENVRREKRRGGDRYYSGPRHE